eukprot:scaffold61871_cov65-Phaeocystis_antarctica.AAC.11
MACQQPLRSLGAGRSGLARTTPTSRLLPAPVRRTTVADGLSSRRIPSISSSSSASACSVWLSTITSALSTNSASTSITDRSARWARSSFFAASTSARGNVFFCSSSSRTVRASTTATSFAWWPSLAIASAIRDGRARAWGITTTSWAPGGSCGVAVMYSFTSNAWFGVASRPVSLTTSLISGSLTSTVARWSSLRMQRAVAILSSVERLLTTMASGASRRLCLLPASARRERRFDMCG